ncbi:phospholipid-binding lipoprotein MlaA [Blastomonas natatoria]|uniref:Phospholipid-binding lipoprotein MlaA n=1 Tax=Blastomonas natatoria TaxID=34015 RepID=A0A2V3UTJ2_9SPHN|nr:VacJ family lipoprotein [Blastomonas natatoria]PXW70087.1 phospholipid-binding lipoprotein MlaA [Blastomonas natatoria]
MSLAALPLALVLSTMQAGAEPVVPPSGSPIRTEQAMPALPPCPANAPLPGAPADAPASLDQGGAIVVTARPDSEPGDPMLQLNAQSFEVVQDVDEALVGPVAMAYKDAVPKPVRHGIRNFLRNLTEPIVALNFLLQLKPGKAAETVGRFAINSTIGIGGLFDVAKRDPFKLPYRRNGFANTLGYYGVEPGAYLFLPLIGPTTVRDLVGGTIDGLLLPTVAGAPFNDPYFTLPAATLSALQGRIQIDEQLNALRNQSGDPYMAARDFYLKRRQAEIDALKGRVQYPDADLPFVNPGTGRTMVVPVAPVTPSVNCVPVGGL